ncbi:MAG: ABC transporter substrate-binding protein [Deltaproteobacteria bacterium]|nr:ABC transporter substrate-binding protein [Deltaproteobacteria bacterium]
MSLTPSATEVVAALGADKQLVGVDEYSDFPAAVKQLPKVGSFLAPNLEAIVALRPTVVIVDDIHGQTAGALRDAHIHVVECAMHALPDLRAALTAVGHDLGRDAEAKAAIAKLDAAIDAARHAPQHVKVLAVIDREAGGLGNLVAVGPGSWVDELLAVVGAQNVLVNSPVRYPKVTQEEVLRGAPDVILDLSQAATDLAPWSQVDVPATREHRVVALPMFVSRPTVRVDEAIAAIEKALAR